MIANANSIVQHEFQIKSGIMIHASGRVKSIACAKKIIVGEWNGFKKYW